MFDVYLGLPQIQIVFNFCPYCSKEVNDGTFAGINKLVLCCWSAQNIVWGDAGLPRVDTLSPDDPSPSHLNVGIVCYDSRARCVCVCVFGGEKEERKTK